ncbi:hypothetical protein Pam3_21 [Pseudanabaena phage Pam3]|uniref:Uncharacterized protein n=1 Tax=Pseudanabaena phage Pam3 TaxID=2936519 RepID=A0ACD6BAN4_9CAUD|nr:Chain X, Pam3 sheath initiator gp21 [uncultured cyanophage]7YFZ_n Chain n, Pam3 sheath initiator gp21 [uncultured cyanophage]7YFZ_o Chain o, Pam3 sheath initiator gp21 [uncultured cyanophage]7YFZ_p Chain p, Pam3 sheath initiator gp21 [uncultured cyanophage]7YFZ_q Chain q, Pam3 sheath initiator gp21 [uncultured cyanophage]7YFZ_r Chain r, Pam3 sheath initiator gp21 [uncultured cyanophage]UQS95092.1 hypothetical protein Pam3_21 [Pseudanabaena phage Pam3]
MAAPSRIGLALKKNEQGIADIYLDASGNLSMVQNTEAVGQHARQRLMTYLGEWFLNKNVGVPWLRDLLGKGYDPVLAEAVIKAEILSTDGVTEITSFSIRFDQGRRALEAFDIEVTTEYDEETVL